MQMEENTIKINYLSVMLQPLVGHLKRLGFSPLQANHLSS
uniref:Uncharacterized protein n=1 Tax=Rhizophora mucronata TaxID=61149 RepID=A0A2P2K7K8_RHIMU